MVSNYDNDVAQSFVLFNSKIKKTAENKAKPYLRRGITYICLFDIAERIDVLRVFLRFAQIKQVQNNRRNINRRIGSDNYAPDNGKGKTAQRIAAKDQKSQRGQDGTETS